MICCDLEVGRGVDRRGGVDEVVDWRVDEVVDWGVDELVEGRYSRGVD